MKKDIEIIRSKRKTLAMEIKPGGRVIVRVPNGTKQRDIDAFIENHAAWLEKHLQKAEAAQTRLHAETKLTDAEIRRLTERAKAYLPQRVAHYAPLVGVTYGKVTVRHQKTRWGSCSSKGNLNFNCLLMLTPPAVIDSVVVHELCHRKEMNHSTRFYAAVLRVYPDYKKHHRWLKDNGSALLGRLP